MRRSLITLVVVALVGCQKPKEEAFAAGFRPSAFHDGGSAAVGTVGGRGL